MDLFKSFLDNKTIPEPALWDGAKFTIIDDGELYQVVELHRFKHLYLNHETPQYSALYQTNRHIYAVIGYNTLSQQMDICFTHDIGAVHQGCTITNCYEFLVAISSESTMWSKQLVMDTSGLSGILVTANWGSICEVIAASMVDFRLVENRSASLYGCDAYQSALAPQLHV